MKGRALLMILLILMSGMPAVADTVTQGQIINLEGSLYRVERVNDAQVDVLPVDRTGRTIGVTTTYQPASFYGKNPHVPRAGDIITEGTARYRIEVISQSSMGIQPLDALGNPVGGREPVIFQSSTSPGPTPTPPGGTTPSPTPPPTGPTPGAAPRPHLLTVAEFNSPTSSALVDQIVSIDGRNYRVSNIAPGTTAGSTSDVTLVPIGLDGRDNPSGTITRSSSVLVSNPGGIQNQVLGPASTVYPLHGGEFVSFDGKRYAISQVAITGSLSDGTIQPQFAFQEVDSQGRPVSGAAGFSRTLSEIRDATVERRPTTLNQGDIVTFGGTRYKAIQVATSNGQPRAVFQQVDANGNIIPGSPTLPLDQSQWPPDMLATLPLSRIAPQLAPAAPGTAPPPPPTPSTAPAGRQPITGQALGADARLGLSQRDIALYGDKIQQVQTIQTRITAIDTRQQEIVRLLGNTALPEAERAALVAEQGRLTQEKNAKTEERLRLIPGFNVDVFTRASALRTANPTLFARIAASEDTLIPGVFLDKTTGRYFSVKADNTLGQEGIATFDSAAIGRPAGTQFAFSQGQLGIAFGSDGIALNARSGATLNPGDRIELTVQGTSQKISGRVLSTATSGIADDPATTGVDESANLFVETNSGLFDTLFGESELSSFGFRNGQPQGETSSDYNEDVVESLREGFEQQASTLENYLRVIQLENIRAQRPLTPSENDEYVGIALSQQQRQLGEQLARQSSARLQSQLTRILGLIGSERDLSDLEDQDFFGRDPAFPGLTQSDIDLLRKLVGPDGQLPAELAFPLPDGYDQMTAEQKAAALQAPIRAAIDALVRSGKLNEIEAAEALRALEESERNADLSTDRNTIGFKQLFGALSIMKYLGQVSSQYGGLGRFASLFIDDKDMLGLKDEVHQSFCDSVLFGDPSCRAQAFCEITPDHMAGGNVIIGKVNPQFEAAAHMEAFVYPPVFTENVTAARRFKAERLYQVTFSVSVPGEDSNSYNVVFRGPTRTSKLFTSSQPLGQSGSARRDRKNPFLRYSSEVYDTACIEFSKRITDFTGAKHKDLCVPIIQKSGGVPGRVQESADERTSTSERGESADF